MKINRQSGLHLYVVEECCSGWDILGQGFRAAAAAGYPGLTVRDHLVTMARSRASISVRDLPFQGDPAEVDDVGQGEIVHQPQRALPRDRVLPQDIR